MSEIPLVSPLLDGMELLEKFSDRGRTECYYLKQSETGEQFVLKHISIPESDVKTQALILTGAVRNEAAANEYYETVAEDLRGELIRLQSYHEHGGIAAWTDFQIEAREGVGFDAYMLMPRKTSLKDHLRQKAMSQLQALNLGIDLCDALRTLRFSGFTHQNLKPENIFVDAKNHFTIGDLGLMPLKDLQYSAIPEYYINEFSAPELSRLIPEPNETSDVYAVGMILFYIFNGNHLPFEDEKTPPEKAAARRQDARALPTPVYADYELAEIIGVACSLDPVERYASPSELRHALTLYMQRNEVSDQLLVPPLSAEEQDESEEAAEVPEESSDETPADLIVPVVPEPTDGTDPALSGNLPQTDEVRTPEPESETVEEPEEEADKEGGEDSDEEDDEEPDEEDDEDSDEEDDEEPDEEDDEDSDEEDDEEPDEEDDEEPDEEDDEDSDEEDDKEPDEEPEEPEEPVPESIDELLASVNDVLTEDNPEPEAPDIEANEEAVRETPPKKRKRRIWIPLLIALLVLALLGAAVAYFYSNWYLVTMDGIEVTDRTADSITVAYNLSTPDPDLSWDCIDTYGNSYSGVAGENRVVFRDLAPGTQYTVHFYPGKLHKLIGETTATAATQTLTQVVSMGAVQGPDKTTAEIAMVVSGPEPEQWLLTYSSTGSDSGSLYFTGHSAEITGLKLHETYTFELKAPEEVYLSGQTSCELKLIADVAADNLKVSSAAEDSLSITWDSLADTPRAWTVSCVGGDYDESQEVTECAATFRGIRLNQSYTFTVSAEGMNSPLSLTLPANARVVTSLEAEARDAGSVLVEWTSADPQPENGWVVRYRVGSIRGSVSAPEENSAVLTGLPANAEIAITVEPANGDSVIGMNTRTAQTPVASNFGSHEFSIDDSSLTLYVKPSEKDWTYDELGDSAEEFDPETEIAVVLQAPEEFNALDTEETAITLVVRDESGGIGSYSTVSSTWNDIWNDGRYLTSIRLPDAPGKYQVELYFDSQFVNRKVLTVTGEAPEQG